MKAACILAIFIGVFLTGSAQSPPATIDCVYILTLGSIKEGEAAKEAIIANKRLQYYAPGGKCRAVGRVSNFKISFKSATVDVNETLLIIEGNTLSEKAISIIRKLAPKDQVIFTEIRIQDIDSYPRQIDKFVITIQ